VEVAVQDLHRDDALELRVERAPDDRHATLADLLVEAVTTELRKPSRTLALMSRSARPVLIARSLRRPQKDCAAGHFVRAAAADRDMGDRGV
jgi:hypothetical protein